jgi:hypothetical protein
MNKHGLVAVAGSWILLGAMYALYAWFGITGMVVSSLLAVGSLVAYTVGVVLSERPR